jgi:hypothetical protein
MRWQTEGETWDCDNQPLIACHDDKSTKNRCSDINERMSGCELNVQASTVIKLPLNLHFQILHSSDFVFLLPELVHFFST